METKLRGDLEGQPPEAQSSPTLGHSQRSDCGNCGLSPDYSCLRSKSGSVLRKGERFHSNKTEIAADEKGSEGIIRKF